MGGYGSGSWHRRTSKELVTNYFSLDVRRLHREGILHPDAFPHPKTIFGWSWHSHVGESKASIGIRVGRDNVTLNYGYRDRDGKWLDVAER